MLSQDIQSGDVFIDEDGTTVVYTVEEVEVGPTEVRATVRYTDGGNGRRVWDWGRETPVTRPRA